MHKLNQMLLIAIATALASLPAIASEVTGLATFTGGTPAIADEVNGNFTAVKTAVGDNNSRLTAVEMNKQNRVSGTCSSGASITAINSNGSVTCSAIQMPGVKFTNIVQNNIDVRTSAVDVGTVAITAPTAGYVVVRFDGKGVVSSGDLLVLAASDTSQTWSPNDGNVAISLSATGGLRGNFSHTRVYPVTAGAHTFYAVAQNWVETGGNGLASIYGTLTV